LQDKDNWIHNLFFENSEPYYLPSLVEIIFLLWKGIMNQLKRLNLLKAFDVGLFMRDKIDLFLSWEETLSLILAF